MTITIADCPCTGKNMSNMVAPWLLLTLYNHDGLHGYEINKIIRKNFETMGVGLNMTGLYRHLNMMEKRGLLLSEWGPGSRGPSRRRYYLTDAGRQCLWHWIQTLTAHVALIGKFFDYAALVFPDSYLPSIKLPEPGGPNE